MPEKDLGSDLVPGGSIGIVLDFCNRHSLTAYRSSPAWDNSQTMRVLSEVADAMTHVHGSNVLHRDIKAANVLIRSKIGEREGTVEAVLGDFDRALSDVNGKNLKGSNVGTLTHMAPELLASEPYNSKIDVYAYGILAYEVITGRMPYAGLMASGVPGSLSRREFSLRVMEDGLRPPLS